MTYQPPTEAELSGYFRTTGPPFHRADALFEHRLAFDPYGDHAHPSDGEPARWLDRNDPATRRILGDLWFGRCHAAVDLSARVDFTAGALCWDHGDGHYHVDVTVWTPENGLAARERDDAAPYTTWVEAGHIQTVPGGVMDYDAVARWVSGAMARMTWPGWRMTLGALVSLCVNSGSSGLSAMIPKRAAALASRYVDIRKAL